MRRFEYDILDFEDPPDKAMVIVNLNNLGAEGWEVWHMISWHPGKPMYRVYMKREISS